MSADIVKGPVGMLIGLIVWLVTLPMILGAINGWYTQAIDACVIEGERFDRVILKADKAWGNVAATATTLTGTGPVVTPSGTTAYKLSKEGTTCKIGVVPSHATAATNSIAAATWYTPSGTDVETPLTTNVAGAAANILIAGGVWTPASEIMNTAGLGPLIKIILQAAGLAPPIAIMVVLGSFGSSFIRNMGGHPILAAIVTVVGFLMVSTLLNSLVPFLTDAFGAVEAKRFVMFESGLGNVSVIVKRFYGVVLVAGLIVVAWTILSTMRAKDAMAGNQRM